MIKIHKDNLTALYTVYILLNLFCETEIAFVIHQLEYNTKNRKKKILSNYYIT